MAPTYDVLIAGAGPAGTSVAARLAQHGMADRIAILDRYRFPREKPCGGALTGHADLAMAELDLELAVASWPCDSAEVRFGSFRREVAMGRSVRVIRRREFDADLVRQVRGLGVEIVEGEGVVRYQVEADAVVVTTSAGRTLRCKVLVGADGAASVVRKGLGGRAAAGEVPHRLFQLEVALPAGDDVPTMLYDFSPMTYGLRGYLWVFPLAERGLNLGLMHYPTRDESARQGGRQLVELLGRGLADLGIDMPERSARGWPVWGYDPRRPIAAPRVITVGDAAGIDALTGEGIAVAMEQAILAGDCIEAGLRKGDVSFADYGRMVRRAVVGRELVLDRRLARMLYDSKGGMEWLGLVLYDEDMLEMYARRVDGTEVLADAKLRLVKALLRHVWRRRHRRQLLSAASQPSLVTV